MLRRILLASILVFLITGIGFAFQNEPDGFRGLKWGDPPTEDMKYWITSDLEKVYELPDDNMSIGNAKLYLIAYTFYDEPQRFTNVSLFFKGEENYDLLQTICKGRFGEDEMKKGFYKLTWFGQTSFVILDYDMVKERGSLGITSTQITGEEMKASKQKETNEADKQKELKEKRLIVLDGTGQQASEKFFLKKGLVKFNFVYKGQHNFSVWLLDNNGKKVELLVNTIGDFNGSKAIGIDKTGVYLLDISADGYWAITIIRGSDMD